MDFTKTAKTRLIERLKSREEFMTIPKTGVTITGFNRQIASKDGIEIHVTVSDVGRKTYLLHDKRNRRRKFKIKHQRVNIGNHPDLKGGVIIRDVTEDHHVNLEETLNFVNLYLGYNITVDDVNERFFEPRTRSLLIRMRNNSLRYTGQLRVVLV